MIKKTKKPEQKPQKRRLRFKRDNLMKGMVPNKPGVYRMYDKNGKLLYVGVAKKLRHRVQSYNQKDCYDTHPTKKNLRNKIHTYEYEKLPLAKARKKEHRLKKRAPHNHL